MNFKLRSLINTFADERNSGLMNLYRLTRYYRSKEQISDRFDLYWLKRLETAGPMPRFYSLVILWSVKEESLGAMHFGKTKCRQPGVAADVEQASAWLAGDGVQGGF